MPQGICKLCLQTKDLQNSHLIPAAMYKYIRNASKRNPNPVAVGRDVTATTSKQVTDYVLCAGCEDRINNNGEREILKWVWNGKRFPLGDRLAVAHPYYTFTDFIAFSGTAVGVDTEKLAYFALSVIWRAAVHQWDLWFGGKTTVLNLGGLEEPIRQFLHGDSDLPADIAIIVTACTDSASIGSFYTPSRVQNIIGTAFGLHTLGIHFMANVGSDIPAGLRQACCVRSGRHLIFQRNCESKTVEAFVELMKTSKTARGLL